MADGCPTIIGDPAIGMTEEAYQLYTGYAGQAFRAAQGALVNVTGFNITPIDFNIAFDDEGNVGSYDFPDRPLVPVIQFNNVTDPPNPPATTIHNPSLDLPPAYDVTAPVIDALTAPSISLPPQPGPAPTLTQITIPDAPTIVLPDFPGLLAITLPSAPVLNLPTFDGIKPVVNFSPPGNTFAFTPAEYTSALLDKTSATVSSMLDGDTGLPLAVIQALRARAYSAQDIAETRAVQQAIEEYGQLGWSEPNGVLEQRVARVRQDNQNERNKLSRDIYINDEQIAVDNRRFAVTSGIALESALFNAHTQFLQVSLDAAKTASQVKIDIFNAQVSLFNAQEQAYATDAQVFKTRLEAEIESTLGVYKTEIEAQQLIGTLNQQSVAVFTARVQSLLSITELYRSQIAGKQAQADVNRAIIEAFRAEVEAYAAEVRGYEAAWEGFKAQNEAELTKARIYETATNAYSTRVSAWGKQQDVKISATNLQIATADLQQRGWRGLLDKYIAKLQGERDRVSAEVQVFQGNTELYKADASIQETASGVRQRGLQLILAKEQARVDTALKNAQLELEQLEKLTALALEKAKTLGTISAQLAASAMSAVSFHAGVTSSREQSQSCATQFQFLGSST